MRLCDGKASFAKDADHRVDVLSTLRRVLKQCSHPGIGY